MKYEPRTCSQCGKEFVPHTKYQIYCSSVCRHKHNIESLNYKKEFILQFVLDNASKVVCPPKMQNIWCDRKATDENCKACWMEAAEEAYERKKK